MFIAGLGHLAAHFGKDFDEQALAFPSLNDFAIVWLEVPLQASALLTIVTSS